MHGDEGDLCGLDRAPKGMWAGPKTLTFLASLGKPRECLPKFQPLKLTLSLGKQP